ncbi:YhgE/Pip domain-containing protein [Cryobacterium algoritolerans]|nr:YhgE/Pip domain-containing protein [Cryobacterium algoritolerans]
MKIFAMVRAELARLTATVMSRIALMALLLVPVLYGGLYLWANQDPYAGLNRVPVALVVADTGAPVTGTSSADTAHNYGDEVATQLVDDGTFQWHRVSAATARAGVADARYDFSVTIPADFSTAIASSAGSNPRQATITLTTNDTNSYLASTIGNQAAKTLREAIVAKVNKQAADRLLIGLSDVRANLVTAAAGAGRVTDGAASAGNGSVSLADGAGRLADGAGVLATGLGRLASGTGQVADAAAALSVGTGALATGTGQVADGAAQVAGGTTALSAGTVDLATGTGQVADGAAQVAAGTQSLADGAPALKAATGQAGTALANTGASLTAARSAIRTRLETAGLSPEQIQAVLAELDPVTTGLGTGGAIVTGIDGQVGLLVDSSAALSAGAAQTAAGASAAATGATTVRDKTALLAAGADKTSAGAAQSATGARSAANGAAGLATGAADVRDGASSASAGANAASAGASSLSSGAATLRDGLGVLQTGAGTLRDGLANGVTSIPDSTPEARTLQGSTIADPVALETAAVTSAGTYGAGLAPFFASLAGWIGIYALFLIVKPVSRRAITALHSPLKITLAGWLTPGLLGMVQMAALFAILAGVLKFEVHNPVGTYSMMGLAALAFAAIILALNVWLGSVGQFIGLVLMVIQLVTAGGTFPWQTLPAPLAWLHHVVPMSYAVDGIRQLMYGGNPATAWTDAGVLLLWLAGALTLAAIGVTRMTHFRTLRDLKPSLIG